MSQTKIRHLLAFVWGVYGGAVAGYFLTKRRYQKIADEEIASVIDTFNRRYKTGKYETVSSAAAVLVAGGPITTDEDKEEAEKIIESSGYMDEESHPDEGLDEFLPPEEVEGLDDEPQDIDGEDLEPNVHFDPLPEDAVVTKKYPPTEVVDPDIPYPISVEEFLSDEPDHDKITLTYYDGDDVLASDKGEVIRNMAKVVGDEFLTKFGWRSDDNNVVYVRNEKFKCDYEVTLEERSYGEVVLNYRDKTTRGIRFTEDS